MTTALGRPYVLRNPKPHLLYPDQEHAERVLAAAFETIDNLRRLVFALEAHHFNRPTPGELADAYDALGPNDLYDNEPER